MKTGEKALAGIGLAIPLGYVVWEATRRKNGVRIEGVGIEAAGELPLERTWNAITVVTEEPPTGMIDAAWVRANATWYPHTQFPVSLAPGTRVRARVQGRNTSGRTVRMQLQVHLIDPTGTLRGYNSVTEDLSHNERVRVTTPTDVSLDVDGTWVIKGVLKEA